MLSLAQVEVTDAPVIKAVLDYVPKFDKRYESLYAYYFGISPEENHNFHVTVLAKVLKQKTADKKDIYQHRLTKVQRKDLYKLIITKDLLFRNKTDNKILKDYLRYHASFDFTRDEMKELVKVYARLANFLSDVGAFIDTYYKDLDRGVSERTIVPKELKFTPPTISSIVTDSKQLDKEYLPTEPITKWVQDELISILSEKDHARCFTKMQSFITTTISPFDARRLDYQLSNIKNDLTARFFRQFPENQSQSTQLRKAIVRQGMSDTAWYASSTFQSGHAYSSVGDVQKAMDHKDKEYREGKSLAQPKPDPLLALQETKRKIVVNKKSVETFKQELAAAMKAEEGKAYDAVIIIVNKLSTDEVRYCLSVFFSFQSDDSIPINVKWGYRTRQVFTELMTRGVKACDLADDFVEDYYLKLKENSLKAPALDDIQRYFLSMSQKAGAYNMDALAFQRDIRNALYKASEERKLNHSLVFSLIDYQRNNTEIRDFSVAQLLKLEPANDENLKSLFKNLVEMVEISFERKDFDQLLINFKIFRDYLTGQDNELKLFQILKWAAEYFNQTKRFPVMAREIYLEVYSNITWFAFEKKKIYAYTKGMPAIDLEFFSSAIEEGRWSRFKEDVQTRLAFAARYPQRARDLTEYMLYLHVFAEKQKTPLVPNTERELAVRAKEKNEKDLARRVAKPDWGYPNVVHNVKIGDSISGFTIYYIKEFGEELGLKDENKSMRIFLQMESIKSFLFDLPYMDIGEKQFEDIIKDIYNKTAHLVGAIEFFFKAIGYLPVLIEAGPIALGYEILVSEGSEKLGEVVGEYSPKAGFIVGLAGNVLTPRPKALFTSKADRILATQAEELGERTIAKGKMVDPLESGTAAEEGKPDISSKGIQDKGIPAGTVRAPEPPGTVYNLSPNAAGTISEAPRKLSSGGAKANNFTGGQINEGINHIADSIGGVSKKMAKKAISNLKKEFGISSNKDILVEYYGNVFHVKTGEFLGNLKETVAEIEWLKSAAAKAFKSEMTQQFGKKGADRIISAIENRHNLRKAMKLTDPSVQAHHLIPVEVLKNSPVVQAAVAGGFDFNGIANGLPLSSKIHLTAHDSYNTNLEVTLSKWGAEHPNYSSADAAKFLEATVIKEWKANFQTAAPVRDVDYAAKTANLSDYAKTNKDVRKGMIEQVDAARKYEEKKK